MKPLFIILLFPFVCFSGCKGFLKPEVEVGTFDPVQVGVTTFSVDLPERGGFWWLLIGDPPLDSEASDVQIRIWLQNRSSTPFSYRTNSTVAPKAEILFFEGTLKEYWDKSTLRISSDVKIEMDLALEVLEPSQHSPSSPLQVRAVGSFP